MLVLRDPARLLALALLALASLAPLPARAQMVGRVLFAVEQGVDDDRTVALRAELGLRALGLELVPAIAGESDAARERQARLLAEQRGAYATLWIDAARDEARAVTPAGTMRRATLPRPAATIDPRVLAVLLGSLLDEALTPPERPAAEPLPSGVFVPDESVVVVPAERRVPDFEPEDPDDPHDGDVHLYALVDFSVGAVWSLGEQKNVAHLVQRLGAGLLVDRVRFEAMLGMGIDYAMDGGYGEAFAVHAQVYGGTSIPAGFASLELGGLLGYMGHEFEDALVRSETGMMSAVTFGGAIGLTMRDSLSVFPFRARLEVGGFFRPTPATRLAPFTTVVLGVGFW